MSKVHFVLFPLFFFINVCVNFNIYNNACKDYKDYFLRVWSQNCYYNPDVSLNTPTLISNYGYPLESYTLTTQDDYILTIFRIPSKDNRVNKQVVFLIHGLFTSNVVWVQRGNKSLAFRLADEGYDVWIGNIRGNEFARFHQTFNVSNKEYWKFSLDSLAYYDIGAQLKFISEKINRRGAIICLGYSSGATLTLMYAAGYWSESKTLLSAIISLAPVFYTNDIPAREFFDKTNAPFQRELDRQHVYALFNEKNFNKNMLHLCKKSPYFCKKILEIISGNKTVSFQPDDLLLFFSKFPTGVSVQCLKHFLQIIDNGFVKRYDFGRELNLEYYHRNEPRRYDLRYIKVPVYLFHGKNDIFSSEKDVKRLYQTIGSSRKKLIYVFSRTKNNFTPFNHLDFLTDRNIQRNFYPLLFKVLKEHISKNKN